MLDPTDLAILKLLQANARTSNADIARRLDMAPSAILDRIRKLEQRRVIQGYAAQIDPAAVGLGLTAFILVRTEERVGAGTIGEALAENPGGTRGTPCSWRRLLSGQGASARHRSAEPPSPGAVRPPGRCSKHPQYHCALHRQGIPGLASVQTRMRRKMTPEIAGRARLRLALAFGAVYLVWGSTYLAIAFAIQTMPPFLMLSGRFLLAGGALYVWARYRGNARPRARQWTWAFLLGGLFLLIGNGTVGWVEQRLSSGLTALIVALVSVWTALLEWIRPGGRRPDAMVLAGIVLGFLGVALLVVPGQVGGGHVDPVVVLALVGSTFAWALASVLSRNADLPASAPLVSGMEMLAGGGLLLLASLVAGEWGRFDLGAITLTLGPGVRLPRADRLAGHFHRLCMAAPGQYAQQGGHIGLREPDGRGVPGMGVRGRGPHAAIAPGIRGDCCRRGAHHHRPGIRRDSAAPRGRGFRTQWLIRDASSVDGAGGPAYDALMRHVASLSAANRSNCWGNRFR